MTGYRDTVGNAERVVAAELRHVDVGACRERFAVADVAEPPDRAAVGEFDTRIAGHGLALGIEGDRVIAGDCETGIPVHHDPFGSGGRHERRGCRSASRTGRPQAAACARSVPLLVVVG